METCEDGGLHDIHEAPTGVWVCVVCGEEYDDEPDFEYDQT